MAKIDTTLNLPAWKVEVNPPQQFQSEVWKRIASRAPARRKFWDGWLDYFVFELPRPACAAALILISIGLGIGLGHSAADKARETALQEGRGIYMATINPLGHSDHSL